jgi:hypothetical protein
LKKQIYKKVDRNDRCETVLNPMHLIGRLPHGIGPLQMKFSTRRRHARHYIFIVTVFRAQALFVIGSDELRVRFTMCRMFETITKPIAVALHGVILHVEGKETHDRRARVVAGKYYTKKKNIYIYI